jgi:hypothetical protein
MAVSGCMRLLQTLLLSTWLFTSLGQGQQKEWPEVEKFATDLKDVIWDLQGTHSLKHLRFDGESFHAVTQTGQSRSKYKEHAFVDVGVFQLVFSESRSAWYFVSDDLKLITPVNVSGEIEFKAESGTAVKPVKNFPQDIQNVVWVGGPEVTPIKLRWNGTEFEVGVKTTAWEVQKVRPVIANRRVFEFVHEGDPIWIAFSADGAEAWWLNITDVFGGHARSSPATAALDAQTTGLPPTQNDVANHAEGLLKASDRMRAATLLRELERKNVTKPKALQHLQERFKSLQP